MIARSAWRPADGLTLEPNALRAAKELECCLALTAGPGAGKTEMLAQRADFLLRTGSCRNPKRILAISFKVDASTNLKARVLSRCGTELASRFDSYTFHAFSKQIIDRFRLLLSGSDALNVDYKIGDHKVERKQIEFADLVPLAIQIVESSNIARNAIRQTYSDVFLDEFQDCTSLQYKLVKCAFQGTNIRITAVGDTKQKIMGWAGALEGVFETFALDFAAVPLNMYRNFRSKPRLLRMQNEIIRIMDPASVMPEVLLTGEGGEVFALHFENSQEEAEHLADLIVTWIRTERIPVSEITILVSKQIDLYANHLMTALNSRCIQFRNEGKMQDISTEPVARLIVDYLSCLYGQREPKAWICLMNQVVPFIDEAMQYSILLDFEFYIREQKKRIAPFEPNSTRYSGWWEFAIGFLKKIGIEAIVAFSPDYESKARLKEVIEETRVRIEELLKLESDLPKALKRFSDDQAVRIMTIHKSKGLEFDSVIILGVEHQTFWGAEEAERCGFFVGMSRAKRRLILTFCNTRETPLSNPRRWQEQREPHTEFLSYAKPFLSQEIVS